MSKYTQTLQTPQQNKATQTDHFDDVCKDITALKPGESRTSFKTYLEEKKKVESKMSKCTQTIQTQENKSTQTDQFDVCEEVKSLKRKIADLHGDVTEILRIIKNKDIVTPIIDVTKDLEPAPSSFLLQEFLEPKQEQNDQEHTVTPLPELLQPTLEHNDQEHTVTITLPGRSSFPTDNQFFSLSSAMLNSTDMVDCAYKLILHIFTDDELRNSSISGKRGKSKFDEQKITWVKQQITSKFKNNEEEWRIAEPKLSIRLRNYRAKLK